MTDDLSKLKIQRDPIQPTNRVRRRRPWGRVALGLVLIAGAAFVFWPRAQEVRTTTVVSAYPSQQYVVLNAAGYVVAQRKAAVSSKATGRLEWLGVVEGSKVKEGEILARIDSRDVVAARDSAVANVNVARAGLDTAKAEADVAKRELTRARDLVAEGFLSKSAADAALERQEKAEAGVVSARAGIAAAQASEHGAAINVEYTLVRAPFDGVVLSKNANVGDIVTPFSSAIDSKSAVVTMADMSTLEVEADVSEASLSLVRPGQPCEIALDALPDMRFRAVVNRIVPTVDRAKATVMTKVKFIDTDARVLPEMSAKVSFLSREVGKEQERPVIAVSADALVRRNGRTVVYVVQDGKAREVPVTTSSTIGSLVALSGVHPGDTVITKPSEALRDGVAVQVSAK